MLAAASALLAFPAALHAQAGPRHAVRIIIAGAAGGGGDLVVRAMADKLALRLGQEVVVEPKPGANGVLAAHEVLAAPSDGHTLLLTTAAATIGSQALRRSGTADILPRLVPVAQIGQGGNLFVASTKLPVDDLQQFIGLARRHPGRYSYGTLGIGSAGHLLMEALKRMEGLDLAHVPYRSAAQIYQDLRADLLAVAFVDPVSSVPFVKQGLIKAIGISGTTRAALNLPDVPTFAEQQVPLALDGWYALFMAKGTPPEVVEQLNSAVLGLWKDPDVVARMKNLGIDALPTYSADEFAAHVASELANWQQLVKTSGVVLD